MSKNYFANYTSKFVANTNESNSELFHAYRNGDKSAYDKIVSGNMPLVLKIASSYIGYGMDMDDLTSNGVIGLLKAVEGYNPDKGNFATYAREWIDKYIRMGLNQRQIHHKRYERMSKEERQQVTCESLNEKIGDGENEFSDLLESDTPNAFDIASNECDIETMLDAVDNLPERNRHIVKSYIGLDCQKQRLENIASTLNITRERARQLLQESFATIRQALDK